MGVSTVGPCINLNRAVFGPPASHETWLAESRAALVRSEADAELFRLGSRGWWGGEPVGPEWIGRVFTGVLGAEPSGTCAGALFAIHTR